MELATPPIGFLLYQLYYFQHSRPFRWLSVVQADIGHQVLSALHKGGCTHGPKLLRVDDVNYETPRQPVRFKIPGRTAGIKIGPPTARGRRASVRGRSVAKGSVADSTHASTRKSGTRTGMIDVTK